jgi:hypothetical protein
MDTEVVYLGHNNKIDLQLKASSVAQALSSVTAISLTFGNTKIENSSAASGAIIWSSASFSTGQVRLNLGDQTIAAGKYHAPLIVYDASNASGVVWGYVPIIIKADPEGS